MTLLQLLGSSWSRLGAVIIATIGIYLAVIVATRLLGLRSFAKMSAFDFAATIATGSILAAVAVSSASLSSGALAVGTLFLAQWVTARVRRNAAVKHVVDNRPLMLMDGGDLLESNLRAAGIHVDDVHGKLREANVTRREQIRYVILEATGDISVLHTDSPNDVVEEFLLAGIRR
ncbi:MAG: DUF421 domain-containing protein [Euzebya sp.]